MDISPKRILVVCLSPKRITVDLLAPNGHRPYDKEFNQT